MKKQLRYGRSVVAILLVFAFLLAACGEGANDEVAETSTTASPEDTTTIPDDTTTSPDDTTTSPEETGLVLDGELVIPNDLLEEARSAPGVFYTSLNEDAATEILGRFEEETGITLELVRLGSVALEERIYSEYGAGVLPADVISMTENSVPDLAEAGIVVPYEPPAIDEIDAQYRDPENRWYVSDYSPLNFVYNNQILSPDEVPTSWLDLVENPRYSELGIGAVEPGVGGGWLVAMMQRELLGLSYWEQHSAIEGLRIYDSHVPLSQDMTRGEIAMGPVSGTTLSNAIADGAPLSIAVMEEGTPALGSRVGVTDGGTNPAAGRAFLNWLLSREGMTFAAGNFNKYGVRSDVPEPGSPEAGGVVPPRESLWEPDASQVEEVQEEWTREWYDIYGYTPVSS